MSVISIDSKYSPGDIIIGLVNGRFYKFKIVRVKVIFYDSDKPDSAVLKYECAPTNGLAEEVCDNFIFSENEIYTKEELISIIEAL